MPQPNSGKMNHGNEALVIAQMITRNTWIAAQTTKCSQNHCLRTILRASRSRIASSPNSSTFLSFFECLHDLFACPRQRWLDRRRLRLVVYGAAEAGGRKAAASRRASAGARRRVGGPFCERAPGARDLLLERLE